MPSQSEQKTSVPPWKEEGRGNVHRGQLSIFAAKTGFALTRGSKECMGKKGGNVVKKG